MDRNFRSSEAERNCSSYRAKFITYNVLVATPLILAIPYLPSTVRGHDVFWPIIAGIFLSFFVVSLVMKKRAMPSFLWAILWFVGTLLVGEVLAVMIHGIGPCL
jgi:hypothetical protein